MESYDKVPGYRDKTKEKSVQINNLDNFKPLNNHVLVKPDMGHSKIKYKSLELVMDTSYEPGVHAPNKGEVIKAPRKFVYPKNKRDAHDPDWKTTIEIKRGDIVWFDYLTGMETTWIEYKEDIFYMIPYQSLYVAKRGEEVIPLNGYLLCEPIIDRKKYLARVVEEENTEYGIVAYLGKRNSLYRAVKRSGGDIKYYDDPAIKVGDKVRYSLANNIDLEREEHLSFNGKQKYKVVQRRFLDGIVKE